MNQKVLALALAFALCLSITACSQTGQVGISDTSAETAAPAESEQATETTPARTAAASESTSTPAEITTAQTSHTTATAAPEKITSAPKTEPPAETPPPVQTKPPVETAAPQTKPATEAPEPVVTTTAAPRPPVTTTTTAAPAPPETEPPASSGNYGQRPQTQTEIDFSNRVFELVNEERAKAGLSPFKKLDNLSAAANIRAWEQSVLFGHTRPDGRGFPTVFLENGLDYNLCGENVAAGQTSPEEVMKMWMDSPPHRSNILSESYVYMEVGYYNIPGTEYTNYWSQNFFKPFD